MPFTKCVTWNGDTRSSFNVWELAFSSFKQPPCFKRNTEHKKEKEKNVKTNVSDLEYPTVNAQCSMPMLYFMSNECLLNFIYSLI